LDSPTKGGRYLDSPTKGRRYWDSPTKGGRYWDSPTKGERYLDSPTKGGRYLDSPTKDGRAAILVTGKWLSPDDDDDDDDEKYTMKTDLQFTDHDLIPARNVSFAAMQGPASGSNVRYYPTYGQDELRNVVKQRQGVLQGCSFSLYLFNIFIDYIIG
jgi:hypothetical protein